MQDLTDLQKLEGSAQSSAHSTTSRWLLKTSKEETPQPLQAACVTRTAQKCFITFRRNLLICWFVPITSCPSLDITEQNLAPSSLHSHFRCLWTLMRPSLLQAEQSHLPQPLLTGEVP